ncbi:MAG: thiamine pyrophosphate-dependent enzyme [Caldiserica bacterium]|jgi:indolepyruvate ferredoxin oxidoreductase alpha subunit|nr:thiamine pyrophosphate-dependent enzyme [Caldisericota bacterium]
MSSITDRNEGKRVLLMGNEAIARGALEGNVRFATAYPGTPSSEILETLLKAKLEIPIYAEWSINEKVAFEVAFGASLVGVRSLVAMKNAGFNWVMDPFMTISYTGCKAGMLIVVADDPGAHYSSNEQDTRFGAEYNKLLCFEPSCQDEARLMARDAFSLSESFELPIFLRSVTRLSHASGDVTLGKLPDAPDERLLGFNKHWKIPYRWNVYGPPGAVSKHQWLLSRQGMIQEYVETTPYNKFEKGELPFAIISSGIGASYCDEAIKNLGLSGKISYLRLGIARPLPIKFLIELLNTCKLVLVVEEGDPVVEGQFRRFTQKQGKCLEIKGKEDNFIPQFDEINTDVVEEAIQKAFGETVKNRSLEKPYQLEKFKERVVPRSSTLCAGCPHLGSYWGLKKAIQKEKEVVVVNGDIGCYEQGGYGIFSKKDLSSPDNHKRYPINSPYTILDTLYVMGSGASMAQGMAQSGYPGKCVGVCGDSTFFHAILPSLANGVANKANFTLLVLDNRWTAMTGHQPSPTSCTKDPGAPQTILSIPEVVKAFGVQDIHIVNAYQVNEVQAAIEKAFTFNGPSVVILEGECMLQVVRHTKRKWQKTIIDQEKCTGCKTCIQLGCPAINFKDGKALIDKLQCVDCGLCAQVCPFEAIEGGIEWN